MKYRIQKIKVTEDYYIDTNGIVFRAVDDNLKQLRYLTPRLSNKGYYRVAIQLIDGTRKEKLVHRIVAENFLENNGNLETVNHKDGRKMNNSVYNLEWMTLSDNVRHAFSSGLVDLNAIGRKRIVIPDELIEAIKNDYTGAHGDRKIILDKYGVSYRALLEIIGPFDKDAHVDSYIADRARELYKGKHGDIKRISNELGITPYLVKKCLFK